MHQVLRSLNKRWTLKYVSATKERMSSTWWPLKWARLLKKNISHLASQFKTALLIILSANKRPKTKLRNTVITRRFKVEFNLTSRELCHTKPYQEVTIIKALLEVDLQPWKKKGIKQAKLNPMISIKAVYRPFLVQFWTLATLKYTKITIKWVIITVKAE